MVLGTLLGTPAWAEDIKVKYKADRIQYTKDKQTFQLLGHVEMTVRDIVITSERIDYNTDLKVLSSPEDFEMVQTVNGAKRKLQGKSFSYDVKLQRIEATDIYLVMAAPMPGQEIYISGDRMVAYEDGKRVVFENGTYTTCNDFDDLHRAKDTETHLDSHAGHYRMLADILDFWDGERVYAWNARIFSHSAQLFWFPFWMVPLKSPGSIQKPDVNIGQNPVEGAYTSFRNYYQWNEYHDGYWYLTLMEKKGVGIGFQHDWIAAPNSITRLYFYGLPVTKEILGVPGALLSGPATTEAEQQVQGFLSQQLAEQGGRFFDPIAHWLSNKFTDRHLELRHKQRLLPNMEADFVYTDRDFYEVSLLVAPRNPTRSFEFNLVDSEIFRLDPSNDLRLDTTASMKQAVNSPIIITPRQGTNQQDQRITFNETETRMANVTATLGQTNLAVRTNWNQNSSSTVTQVLTEGKISDRQATVPQGNEIWNTTLDYRVPLSEKTTLSTNLVYNSNLSGVGAGPTAQLSQTLQPKVTLSQTLDWGSLELNYEDFFSLSPDRNNPQGQNLFSGQIRKLPELNFTLNPFFQETFPIQLETRIGRYFDPGVPANVQAQSNLNEIGRNVLKVSLQSKEHDLGMGMKLNLGGTNFEQRFYQTRDAEYIFTGRAFVKNDLNKWFVPSLTYERAVQDQVNNNSPFVNFDPLQLRNLNTLTANLALFNMPELTWTFDGGYDYLNRRYMPLRTDLSSQWGDHFVLRANTNFTPVNITDADVGKPLRDSDGNTYHHLDPVNGETFMVQPEDVGRFMGYGGRWGITTLGFRWRSTDLPFATGAMSYFGLDENIPQGIEFGSDISYDFHLGRIQGLNGLLKFSFGDNWLWHTEVDLVLSVQPTKIPTSAEDWANLQVPFRLVVRKDLHDFLLTFSWDSFYQQFNVNFSLLAFPFGSGDILGNVRSLNQQINSAGGAVNQGLVNR